MGEVWRLFTFVLIPEAEVCYHGFVLILLLLYRKHARENMGSGKFTIYYFGGVILNILYGFLVWAITGLPSIPEG